MLLSQSPLFSAYSKLLRGFLLLGLLAIPGFRAEAGWLQQIPQTTTDSLSDTTRTQVYQPSRRPTAQPLDRYGDPLSNRPNRSPLYGQPPTTTTYEIDTGLNYTIYERLGDVLYRPPTRLSFEEYTRLRQQELRRQYWKEQAAGLDGESAVSGRSLIPPIYTSPLVDRIFGGSFVNIRPNGFVTLDLGASIDRKDDPTLNVRSQRQTQFIFDQQINMNVIGQIGEKLEIGANFDSNNSFDFENNFRVEYTGFPEEIIKKLEIGNVNLPVRNSLMTGAQSLFGVKTQLQFGKLFVTGVATTQRGESDVIEIEGGSQSSTFSVPASEYDENRHFFLGHFFENNYGINQGQWLSNLPQIISGINITRLEVYVINRNQQTDGLRNVVAFTDLAEGNRGELVQPVNSLVGQVRGGANRNDANQLYQNLRNNPAYRDIDQVDQALTSQGLEASRDYVLIKSARKLNSNDFTFNSKLGYLSLNRTLQNDEALAVAYEYTYNGQRYQVGELTENYQSLPTNSVIFLKLLRPNKVDTRLPTWELMMKNIYALGAQQVTREGFQLNVVYRDDASGLDQPNLQQGTRVDGTPLSQIPLVRLFGLDELNQYNDRQPDGNFDFVEGTTINLDRGYIIFPIKKPFGDHLQSQFGSNQPELVNRFVYDTLYETTQDQAELVASKNKFFITGKFSASSTTEIALQGINIAEGSVRVYAGNTPLTEGIDYQVDYNFGRVKILNEGIVNSGKTIRISYERASLLNFQTRRFLGTQFDYIFNQDVRLGATLLYLNELPVVSRVGIGEEPSKNLKWGLDFNVQKDSRFLTKMVDAIPLIQTKESSTITFSSEFAQMLPGTSNQVNGEGTSYIDDFETAITTYRLDGNVFNWNLASTPLTNAGQFALDGTPNDLSFGYKRARLAWYSVDNIFYRDADRSRYAPGLTDASLENNYLRQVIPQEIFPEQNVTNLQLNESIFDLAYYPGERGPYNYNPQIGPGGTLPNPEQNWAGITREIPGDVNFNKTNIEYIEFWMMDPFISGTNGRNAAFENDAIVNEQSGGRLVFNLGSISEDYINDNQHGFENGLPANYEDVNSVEISPWGRVTNRQYLNNAFDRDLAAQANQDVGADGIRDGDGPLEEGGFFRDELMGAFNNVADDPSGDNFIGYLDSQFNSENLVTRYKYFNNPEGNTPITGNNAGNISTGNPRPNNEDLNDDNTLNDLEEYYEYTINLRPNQLQVGQNYIVDKVTVTNEVNDEEVNWFLFRIPVKDFTDKYGNIQGFQTIRYMRTYLTGFSDPVLLRFARLQLVGSQWRRFTESLDGNGLAVVNEGESTNFTVSAVSLETNGGRSNNPDEIPYVLPPGFNRDRDNSAYNQDVRLNEQSLQVCIDGLEDREDRAVYKNTSLDLVNYGTIKMLMHAEAGKPEARLDDGDVVGFIRLGTDFTDNYYEVEIPLTVTQPGATTAAEIWPDANEFDVPLEALYAVKAERNRLQLEGGGSDNPGGSPTSPNINFRYRGKEKLGNQTLYVKGNPDFSAVQVIMIGVRNPAETGGRNPESVCIWANELRVADFDRRAGYAANARLNTKLADFANITASTRYSSVGFGNLAQKVNERTRDENISYDFSASLAMEKFLPENSRLVVPVFLSFERDIRNPYYDPANPDLPLDAAIASFGTSTERERYRQITQDRSTRRSFNLTNIRLTPKQEEGRKPHVYDLSNLAFTYAYSDVQSNTWEVARYDQRIYKAAVAYNFAPETTPFAPFSQSERFNSPWLQWLKDFNLAPVPSTISIRWDVDRRFRKTQYRGGRELNFGVNPRNTQFEKAFTFNRLYNVRWNLTNSLTLDYDARASAVIDEPNGDIDTDAEREVITDNLRNLGRMKSFDQSVGLNYRLPLDKIPLTNWITADARYETNYTWTAASFVPDISQPDTVASQLERFGNQIQNLRTTGVTGKLDLVGLYNKVELLKKVNTTQRARTRPGPRPGQRPTNNQAAGADEEEEKKELGKAAKALLRGLMSVRSVTLNATQNQGTLLPGFRPRAFLFGLDSGFVAPGASFIFGSQNPDIRYEAARQGWLVESSELTTPFTQSKGTNLDIRADVQPLEDFRIQVDFRKEKTANYSEIYRYNDTLNSYQTLTPSRYGSYSISYLTLATAFDKSVGDNGSEAFNRFREYVGNATNPGIISQRLQPLENQYDLLYQSNSQDVLIPAFLAAYSGQDPAKVKLSPFPAMPLPNWRIDFTGLSKIKGINKRFTSVTLTHAYVSRYSVNSYTNSLEYGSDLGPQGLTLNNDIEDYQSSDNLLGSSIDSVSFLPKFVVNQVLISEKFAPLIGINLRTKSRLTTQLSYNRERNLALDMSNAQVTELKGQDVRVDVGYTARNLKLPFSNRGREIILKNDITFRLGVTLRNTETIQRRLEEAQGNDLTQGSFTYQVNPTISYVINQQLNLQFYVQRSYTNPKVATSYPRSTTDIGFQLRYNITQ